VLNIPTENEIAELFPNGERDLDAITASKHFAGLNQIEAFSLLKENFGHYLEDFTSMGPKAFQYYIKSLLAYIRHSLQKNSPEEFIDDCRDLLETFIMRSEFDSADMILGWQEDAQQIHHEVSDGLNDILEHHEFLYARCMLYRPLNKIKNLIKRWDDCMKKINAINIGIR